ncbi:MAG TPA: sulfotransferase, partial [Rhodocyclaceae bacterium]|nr:sulfotransferase [Rhodocyclaceae bacterium]
TYRRHPEIDEQELAPPVFITGLPRSGTSILFETLSRDRQFGAPANWEIMFPCPPPEATTYATDPRITKAEHLLGQWNRVTPTFPALHEIGARIPHECAVAMCCTFASDTLPVSYQIPGYYTWLLGADLTPAYAYYRRMLKLLQWRNPRRHWLLKSPAHTQYLPVLFAVFPEATVVLTHRDPIRAQASVTSLIGTMYWMRSDKPFDAASFERLLTPEAIAAGLEHVIGQIESGTVPRDRIHDFQFADLLADPATALAALYGRLGLALDESARAAMAAYLAAKPKGKFGIHSYDIGDPARIARERKIFHRYQQYHHVPNET